MCWKRKFNMLSQIQLARSKTDHSNDDEKESEDEELAQKILDKFADNCFHHAKSSHKTFMFDWHVKVNRYSKWDGTLRWRKKVSAIRTGVRKADRVAKEGMRNGVMD
jgi:hypothetical protein